MTKLDDKINKLLEKQGLKVSRSKKPVVQNANSTAKAKRVTTRKPKTGKNVAPRKPQVKKFRRVHGVDPAQFAHKYLQYHCNATAAYKALRPELTDITAQAEAHQALKSPRVQAILWPLLEGLMEREEAQSTWVVKRWLEQAEASPLDYFTINEGGGLGGLNLTNITPEKRRNLRSIRYQRSTSIGEQGSEIVTESWHITVVDQQKAVELLAKSIGMLQVKMDKETEDRIGDLLERGVKRITKMRDAGAWKDIPIEGVFSELG